MGMGAAVRNRILFVLFFLSGLCSLAYQVVWLRLAFAAFGIVTPVMSVVISVFMLGLALGSWGGGRWIGPATRRTGTSAIYFYAGAELVIGLSAFLVPRLFRAGQELLLPLGSIDSAPYMLYSALLLGASILPWCIAMGTTFPLGMAFVKEVDPDERSGFSFLYLANVVGAMTGTALTAVVLIELLGFRATLLTGACVNLFIAAVAVALGLRHPLAPGARGGWDAGPPASRAAELLPARTALILWVLFFTGFISMGAEVVWIRNFTPVLGTVVYAFALVLFVYLLATWIGSWVYRRGLARGSVGSTAGVVSLLPGASLLPVVLTDPRLHTRPLLAVLTIFPFCALLGYLTPKLVDEYARGAPRGGGRAYAVNVMGSILGPLFASYVLLPSLGVRLGLAVLAVPFVLLMAIYQRSATLGDTARAMTSALTALLLLSAVFFNRSLEEGLYPVAELRRDHTATVISGSRGGKKHLLVNGVGVTLQLAETKIMAHMPLAFLDREPEAAAVICLGMGTTFRSLMSWGIESTAVELVRSVRDAFPYYFDDADRLLRNPRGRIVVDDGRRFLQRIDRKYDVITIDPAPPVEAAGASLLYSAEFYEVVKTRLAKRGILQHWFPGSDRLNLKAAARSLVRAFPHVKVYRSIDDWGYHFVASLEPLETPSPEEFLARMPAKARVDLVEWNHGRRRNIREFVTEILAREVPVEDLLHEDPRVVITDDRPFNEYFLLRRMLDGFQEG